MSELIKHECGIALLRLRKPLQFYLDKYETIFYAPKKMFLLMHKQRNRGQDGSGIASVKMNVEPGNKYINRYRSVDQNSIQLIFNKINKKLNNCIARNEKDNWSNADWLKRNINFTGELWLGHLRYGTFGKNSIENCAPTLRQNNWKSRNLILAGNFNMTNLDYLFDELVEIGQSPKEKSDTVTILEKIGHFLDEENLKIFNKYDKKISRKEISKRIEKEIDISSILKKSFKDFDGGYAMSGLIGHGSSFIIRDPNGIRPVYYYTNNEIVVATSERPPIKTAFDCKYSEIKELDPGHALIVNVDGNFSVEEIISPGEKKSCSFERIYFSRGNDPDIYKERKKLGSLLVPQTLKSINFNLKDTIFSFVPNTSETCFYGLVDSLKDYLNNEKLKLLTNKKTGINVLKDFLKNKVRIEKLITKDVKMRTFISTDKGRNDLVSNVYDTTFKLVDSDKDTVVIIDDSIVRGTTLEKSILSLLAKLNSKKVVFVSSSPQIRYPDCYGIDMSKMNQFVAFRALIKLIKDRKMENSIDETYEACKKSLNNNKPINHVKTLYDMFSYDDISNYVAKIVKPKEMKSQFQIIYQNIDNLNKACPNHLGDWYFTGNYPTLGGNLVANRSFINFFEGNKGRAY